MIPQVCQLSSHSSTCPGLPFIKVKPDSACYNKRRNFIGHQRAWLLTHLTHAFPVGTVAVCLRCLHHGIITHSFIIESISSDLSLGWLRCPQQPSCWHLISGHQQLCWLQNTTPIGRSHPLWTWISTMQLFKLSEANLVRKWQVGSCTTFWAC